MVMRRSVSVVTLGWSLFGGCGVTVVSVTGSTLLASSAVVYSRKDAVSLVVSSVVIVVTSVRWSDG